MRPAVKMSTVLSSLVPRNVPYAFGNLSVEGLAAEKIYATVRSLPDAELALRDFAQAADREADGAKGAMWSYRRDYGPVRLLVIDSRCGRILASGRGIFELSGYQEQELLRAVRPK